MPKKRPLCPQCVSNKVVPIMYGMPTHEAWEESQQGKFVLGGCVITAESPKWHCQTCGHQFGKEMPSFEDLENPEPDGIKPLKLEFYIGGYSGPNHSVRLDNGILKYQFSEIYPRPDKEILIVPTNRKWLNFRRKLDAINVWKWKRNYDNPCVCDGTQWAFEIDYGVKKKRSSGSNSYPGCESIVIVDDDRAEENNEFEVLLHALSLLLGGVRIA